MGPYKIDFESTEWANTKAVIFDFDLTLADSTAGGEDCINFALKEMGLPPVEPKQAHETIGHSLEESFFLLTGVNEEAKAARFCSLFVQRADIVMADKTYLFEQVPQTVQLLQASGLKLGIVSTKFRYRIESILEREKLLGCFNVIIGGEDVNAAKPDPSGLLEAIQKIDTPLCECLYVGDHIVDAETAERANVAFAAILTGTTKEEAFEGLKIRAILNSIDELSRLLGI